MVTKSDIESFIASRWGSNSARAVIAASAPLWRPRFISRNRSRIVGVVFASLVCSTDVHHARAQEGIVRSVGGPLPLSVTKGKEFTLEQWADGVYLATGGAGSQECIVINDKNVFLFDTGTTPGGASALLEDIKLITDKPVTTVANSHFHYDHVGGNSIFGPSVQIIGHTYTRNAILTFDPMHREPYKSFTTGLQTRLDALNKQLADEQDEEKKVEIQKQLALVQRDSERAKEIAFVPPSITFDSKMVFYDGAHVIQLLFLGRGHTGGDIVLYLPKERIVCSGDLVEGNLPYLGDGFFNEWVTTLDSLKELNFRLDLPAHGRPFEDKQHITNLQSYLMDLVRQVAKIRAQGATPEQALQRIDLSTHERDWPPRMRPVDIRSIRRIYQWMDERASESTSKK